MGLLFGSSRRDQVHLLSTLQSLDRTSIAGLAAALSWSERKTEHVVREIAAAHGAEIAFDADRRTVAVRHATAPAVPAPATAVAPVAVAIPPSTTRTSPFGTGIRCLSCGAALIATAQGNTSVCPQCGRLSTRRLAASSAAASTTAAPAAPAPSAKPTPAPAPPLPVENGRTVVHEGDRRSQELFAAWVTARPIPCPRCRTALRHRGVGEYGCPSCGHRVAFETSVRHLATPAAPA